MNKFAVLAASLVASFALAFAVYSAESNPNTSGFPRVVASVRLTNLTQAIPSTLILNAPRTGLYRVTPYMAMTTGENGSNAYWLFNVGWTDEAGVEESNVAQLFAAQFPPYDFAIQAGATNTVQEPVPIEAIAGTPITYSVTGPFDGTNSGTYELFISVEQLQ